MSFPVEPTEREAIAWFLDNASASCNGYGSGTISAGCSVAEDCARACIAWLKDCVGIDAQSRVHGHKIEVRFGKAGASYLAEKSESLGFPRDTRFFATWLEKIEQADAFRARFALERSRLVTAIEERSGKGGCFDCGAPDGEESPLEFDHLVPESKRKNVTAWLYEGKWAQAKVESEGCVMRCRADHTKKTKANGDIRGGSRKPISTNASVEAKRARDRQKSKKKHAIGKERIRASKIAASSCADCGALCTVSNLDGFSWVRTDTTNEKRARPSHLSTASDATFNAAIEASRLLCPACLKKDRKRKRGEITDKCNATRKKRKAEKAILDGDAS